MAYLRLLQLLVFFTLIQHGKLESKCCCPCPCNTKNEDVKAEKDTKLNENPTAEPEKNKVGEKVEQENKGTNEDKTRKNEDGKGKTIKEHEVKCRGESYKIIESSEISDLPSQRVISKYMRPLPKPGSNETVKNPKIATDCYYDWAPPSIQDFFDCTFIMRRYSYRWPYGHLTWTLYTRPQHFNEDESDLMYHFCDRISNLIYSKIILWNFEYKPRPSWLPRCGTPIEPSDLNPDKFSRSPTSRGLLLSMIKNDVYPNTITKVENFEQTRRLVFKWPGTEIIVTYHGQSERQNETFGWKIWDATDFTLAALYNTIFIPDPGEDFLDFLK